MSCVQDQWMPCLQWTKILHGLLQLPPAIMCMLPFPLMWSCTSTCSHQHFVSLACLCQEWSVCCNCHLWILCSHQREQRRSYIGEFCSLVSERTTMVLWTCSFQYETATFTPNTVICMVTQCLTYINSTLDILLHKQYFYNFAYNFFYFCHFTVCSYC